MGDEVGRCGRGTLVERSTTAALTHEATLHPFLGPIRGISRSPSKSDSACALYESHTHKSQHAGSVLGWRAARDDHRRPRLRAHLAPECCIVKIEGLTTVRSSFEHGETLARLEAAIRANGMSIVSRVDHASGALEVRVALDPTTLLTFGNRSRQAELVKALRLIALELPFKVLIWQSAPGETWLSYTDFRWLATRYGARRDDVCLFIDMAVMIDGIARKAASPP